MEDKDKTKEQLINELAGLRRKTSELKTIDAEHKKIKESLSESEKRYRAFFEQAADSIVLIDAKTGKLVEFNEKAHVNLGYTHEEFQKLKVSDFEILESVKEVNKHITKIIGKGFDSFETKHRTKDGQILDILVNCRIIPIGRREFIQSIWTDITKRKKADEALRDSEERYRDLFENANDLIQSILPDGRIKYVNLAWKEAMGYSNKDIKEMSFFDIIHPSSQPHCMETFKNVMSGKINEKVEAVFVTKDGRDIMVEGSANCKFVDGKPVATRGIFRDVTERKQAEIALQKAHDNLEMLIKERTAELAESNAALRVLLKQREDDQIEFEHNILSNVKHLVSPYLTKLKRNKPSSKELTYLNILESNLQEIVAPFSQKLSSKYLSFTHKEIQIADLIKDGKQDKDIMEILNISLDTVKTHRRNIRKKLDITNKGINLKTKLLSLS